MVATPGTIPALTQYQPGALPLAGTEAFEIVNTTNATSAASFYMLLTDAVGKAPSVLTNVNPTNSDQIAIYQAATGLPKACSIGNLGVPNGNVVIDGVAGQVYFKNSGTNFDASWTTAIPFFTLQTASISGIATTGGLAVKTVATVASLMVTSGTATNIFATNATFTNLNALGGTANLTVATVANLTVNTAATVATLAVTNGTVVNLRSTAATIASVSVTNLTATNATVTNATATNLFVAALTATAATATNLSVTALTATAATVTGSATIGGNIVVTGSASLGVPLTVVNGGLGTNTLGTFSVLIGGTNQTASVRAVLATTTGMVLTSNGSAAAPSWFGSMVLLNTLTPSAVASTTDTTSLTSTYRDYMIILENVCPATNTTVLQMTIATAGAAFVSGGYISLSNMIVGGIAVDDSSTTALLLSGLRATTSIASSTTAGVSGALFLQNPSSATLLKQINGNVSFQSTNAATLGTASFASNRVAGMFSSTTSPITGLAFGFSAGNIQTGTIKIWGLV